MNKDSASHMLPLSSVLTTEMKHKMYIGLRRQYNYCCNSNESPQSSKELNGYSLLKMKALPVLECECNKGRGKREKYQKRFWEEKKKKKVNQFGGFCMQKYGLLNNFMHSICLRSAGSLECSIKAYTTLDSSIHFSCLIRSGEQVSLNLPSVFLNAKL